MAGMVPNEGITELFALGGGISGTAFGYIACGSGNTAFTSASSELNTEITTANGLPRAASTESLEDSGSGFTDDTLRFVKAFTVTGTQTVKEIGVTNKGTKDAAGEKWLYLEVLGTERALVSGNTYTVTVNVVGARV